MTAHEIEKDLMSWVMANTSEIVVPNYFLGRFECDVLKISNAGQLTEYEIKVSRADFKKDSEKSAITGIHGYEVVEDKYGNKYNKAICKTTSKHDVIREGNRVNRFYYVVPANLITPDEVPAGFGLIYATQYNAAYGSAIRFSIKKVSKLFMKEKAKEQLYKHIATNLTLKLISAKRRMVAAEANARHLREIAK
jgi:hypothetical protein